MGFPVVSSNFGGQEPISDFSKLDIGRCLENISSLIENARNLHGRVVGLGISLGGALFIEYAKKNQGLDYIISVGTPFKLKKRWLISIGLAILPAIYPIWKILAKIKRLRLPPIGASRAIVDYLEGNFLIGLEKVKTPILLVHSKEDPVTDYRATLNFARRLKSKEIKIFENGGHVINYSPQAIIETLINNNFQIKNFEPANII